SYGPQPPRELLSGYKKDQTRQIWLLGSAREIGNPPRREPWNGCIGRPFGVLTALGEKGNCHCRRRNAPWRVFGLVLAPSPRHPGRSGATWPRFRRRNGDQSVCFKRRM